MSLAMLAVLGVLLSACGDDRAVTALSVCDSSPAVGASCGGGTVFEINYQNQGTVLIAAGSDVSLADYKLVETDTVNAEDADDGRNNTGTFDAGHPVSFACQGLQSGGYADWYLPAVNELVALFNNKSSVTGIADDDYWSSTEDATVTDAQEVDMQNGNVGTSGKMNLRVSRCIRRTTPSPSFN